LIGLLKTLKIPCYSGVAGGGFWIEASQGKVSSISYVKNQGISKMTSDMVQVVEYLSSKHETLSLISSITKKYLSI
jgi:hypothetical protein